MTHREICQAPDTLGFNLSPSALSLRDPEALDRHLQEYNVNPTRAVNVGSPRGPPVLRRRWGSEGCPCVHRSFRPSVLVATQRTLFLHPIVASLNYCCLVGPSTWNYCLILELVGSSSHLSGVTSSVKACDVPERTESPGRYGGNMMLLFLFSGKPRF